MSHCARRAVALALFLALGCDPGPDRPPLEAPDATRFRGPIVLVTLSGLRPDVVGALRASSSIWTPNIDAFAREADWVGSSVAASSAPAVALASLMSGVAPWQHQILTHKPGPPRPGIPLLAEVLRDAGYRTIARIPLVYQLHLFGLLNGFEDVADIEPIAEAAAILDRPVGNAPELLWFHLQEASMAFERRDTELSRLASRSTGLPRRFEDWRLLPYADPLLPLPGDQRTAAWELFAHDVAWADRQVGEILRRLRASGRWDRAWVVVTASQGFEFGEHDQVLYAQNLGRESIEVPLLIKLPRSLRGSLAIAQDVPAGQARLWATLVEGSGVRPEPVREPSLFRAAAPPVVSELYRRNGVNEFSLLDGDLQLFWSTRFAAEEPEFYLAQLASRGGRPPLSEPARQILGRLAAAFERTLPLSGRSDGEPPALRLERWTRTGVEPVEDRARAEEMANTLRRRWMRHVDRERTPAEESSLSAPLR